MGILLAALFQPVWQTGIRGGAEFSLAFVLLVSWRQPALRVVLFCAGVGGVTLDPFLCRITALLGNVVAGAGVNSADQYWGFWPLLPL